MSDSPTGTYHIVINQFASYRMFFTWKTSGEVQQPINNTGYKVFMQVRQGYENSVTLFEASSINGQFILGGANGMVTFTMTDEQTGKLRPINNAIYDILMISPTRFITRVMEGSFKVRPGVSRAPN